jgi:hypothetical protein
VALSDSKKQEQISASKLFLNNSLDLVVTFNYQLTQNGGHSAVLSRADGARTGGLGEEKLVLQGMAFFLVD